MRKILIILILLVVFFVVTRSQEGTNNGNVMPANKTAPEPTIVIEELSLIVLKAYMSSRSHTTFDVKFTNKSSQYIKHWAINIEVYDSNNNYLRSGQSMVSEIAPETSKIGEVIFLDTNLKNIGRYVATIDGIVGDNGLRIDRQFYLSVE